MDIHKPKAAHSWREFATEIGTIICGILIALAAEQAAEQLHLRERVREVHGQLLSETSANAGSALEWLAISPCLDQQLLAADQAAWQARNTGVLRPAEHRFAPPLEEFTSDSWLNARSLQVADHLSPEEVKSFTRAYFMASEMAGNITSLHEQAGALEPLARPLDHVSGAEADELIAKIGRAKELQSRMVEASVLLILSADGVHAPDPLAQAQADLPALRKLHGACVADPAEMERRARSLPPEGLFRHMGLAEPDLPG